MTYDELKAALDGLYAYDTGSIDSGIRDENLRARAIGQFHDLTGTEHRALLGRIVVDLFLSENALANGYGPEDAREFLEWCDDNGILLSIRPEGTP